MLGLPGDLAQLRGRLGVPVGAEQGDGLRGQGAGQESQQPQRRLVSPLQVVEHHEHRPPGGQAAEAPRDRSNKRNWASPAAAALIGSADPEARCSSQPASPRSAAGRPLARSTCDQGQ